MNIDIIFIRVNIYPGPEEGGYSSFITSFIFSGSLFTWRQPYPTILAKVTIYPARFIAIIYIRPMNFCLDIAKIL
jgi:hypothetical protein